MSETTQPETHEFSVETKKLLQIIIHSLYQNREIFLRELISNSSDALNKLRFEQLTNENIYDAAAPLQVNVRFDKEAKEIRIIDSGVGMTKEEIATNLGVIASSGSLAFLEKLKAEGKSPEEATEDMDIIGQFGVGFYSVFMVSDDVTVRTRSYKPDAVAVEWKSDGSGTYTVVDYPEKETRGTEIIVKLKDEDADDFLSEWKLKQIITKYSDYVPFPIYVQDQEEAANKRESLWRKNPDDITEEEYEKFYQHVSGAYDKPSHHIHYSVDAPIQFRTLLFFPEKKNRNLFMPEPEWGLKLYSHNVLIQEQSKDLLPVHFRFVRGVVDSEDIPLNVSRETVQINKILDRIKKSLTRKVIREIGTMAKKDPDKYKKFWEEFGIFIKEGVASDYDNRDKLTKLLRFNSTSLATDELTTLDDYLSRMKEGQDKIYYLMADNLEVARSSPHLEYYKENEYEVLLLPETIDGFVMMNLREYEGKQFESIDTATPQEDKKKEGEDKDEEKKEEDKDDLDKLLDTFKTVLGDKVEGVRFTDRLRESPVRLVNPSGGFGSEMQRVYRVMDENFEIPKKILEVNKNHPIVAGLAKIHSEEPESELVKDTVEQLFENTLVQEGFHPKPGTMVPRINKIIEAAVKKN